VPDGVAVLALDLPGLVGQRLDRRRQLARLAPSADLGGRRGAARMSALMP
jgi:hypothetical protein